MRDRGIVEKDYFKQLRKDLPKPKENTRSKMISEEELFKVFEAFDKDVERKMELPGYHKGFVQHWFKPMLATYFYGGFRRAEVAYDEDLPYSGLKGENLEYIDGKLEMIYLPPPVRDALNVWYPFPKNGKATSCLILNNAVQSGRIIMFLYIIVNQKRVGPSPVDRYTEYSKIIWRKQVYPRNGRYTA
ncbi:hypothetical protein NC796_24995 [Aliifodinibius sp. S!AR15-10]|nr:hypothetical protein [Aliifodinibius sp. S!AR15-10]MDR8394427.1 hypothetical protein [Aliifodinibius sp. S!AR15-10]